MIDRIVNLAAVRAARAELAEIAAAHPGLTRLDAQHRLLHWLAGDPMAPSEKLTEALYLRVSPTDMAQLEELSDRIPIASRNAIARAAMRLGLELIAEDPGRLLAAGPPPKRGRKARS